MAEQSPFGRASGPPFPLDPTGQVVWLGADTLLVAASRYQDARLNPAAAPEHGCWLLELEECDGETARVLFAGGLE